MAIAFDNVSEGSTAGATGISANFTMGSGNGGILIASIMYQTAALNPSVTYNGVAMTSLLTTGSPGNTNVIQVFYMQNPPTGANTLAWSWSGGSNPAVVFAISYLGVGSIEASNSNTKSPSTTFSVAVTTITNNDWVLGLAGYWGSVLSGSTIAATSGTSRQAIWHGASLFRGSVESDTNGGVSIGSTTMNFSMNSVNVGADTGWAGAALALTIGVFSQIQSVSGVAQASIVSVSQVTNANLKSVSGVNNQ